MIKVNIISIKDLLFHTSHTQGIEKLIHLNVRTQG